MVGCKSAHCALNRQGLPGRLTFGTIRESVLSHLRTEFEDAGKGNLFDALQPTIYGDRGEADVRLTGVEHAHVVKEVLA